MPGVPTPKDRFTSLDTLAVARELRPLYRARVDKAFDLPAGGWTLSLRVPHEGRKELLLVPGRYAALLEKSTAHAEELSPFAKELRRLLEGAALEEVPDPAGERLLEVTFRRSDEPHPMRVALEIFGAGNLIVARGETIAAAAQSRKWAHRTVGVGAPYVHPPGRSDPFSLGPAEIEAELARSRSDLASTLGARLALGGPLAEEVVARGGWDPAQASATDAGRMGPELQRVLQELLIEVGDRPAGYLYLRDGVPVDATPYRSARWRETPEVLETSRPTFSVAADEYFSTLVVTPPSAEERARAQLVRDLENQLARQRTAVVELERQVEELQADAAAVFDHYAEAEAATQTVPKGEEAQPTVEARLGERTVELRRDESPRSAAQRLYTEAKRLQAKLAGAVSAVGDAESKLLESSRAAATSPARPTAASGGIAPARRHREHWFERHRWFISSEGGVIVGGRDAQSNDLLVRRHLREGDLYVHADLHGAASVVVKHPAPGGRPLTEVTCREACQWAVAFSKAWRAGLASASAFWVNHDQVSKAGASGEFVARGAWVIHGTKHVMRDLPTELGIGTVDYEGDTLWCVAPPDALRAGGGLRAVLTPGPERERDEREKELVRELELTRGLLQSLLPAGGLSVRRV